jgi:hypothetical protein
MGSNEKYNAVKDGKQFNTREAKTEIFVVNERVL